MKNVLTIIIVLFISVSTFSQKASILDIVNSSPELHAFARTVRSAGATIRLVQKGPYTVFAPSDNAFKVLPSDINNNMQQPQNRNITNSIINYHIIPGKYTEKDLVTAIKKADGRLMVTTLMGKKIAFSLVGNYVKINDEEGHEANVRFSRLTANNGMVHTIDKVLMPKD